MAKTYEEIVSNYDSPDPEWQVTINGKDYTQNVNLMEFEKSINNPVKFTVKTSGISGRETDISQGQEAVFKYAGFELFRGVLQQVDAGTGLTATLKGAGYASELDADSENILSNAGVSNGVFKATDIQNVVDTLIDTSSAANSRAFSTSFSGGTAATTVDEFRANKNQLKDVNRVMGEYDIEWYTSYDGNNDPVFNVTDQIQNDDGGNPLDTIKTSGPGQTAEVVKRNTNRNEGDFDGVLVRGYGDGNDQVSATAGSTGKGNRVLIYTDKTILSDSQAQKRADKLESSKTVTWREIRVKPAEPGKLYGIGDLLKVDAEDAKLDDNYRVVESYYKIDLDQNDISTKLTLSNKAQTFISEFKTEEEKREGETDHMQGARNVWGDKEASNATNAEPLEIDFEVPQDVVDVADNNRLDRIEFNYACTPYRQSGDPQSVTADNFDPSTKVVSTEVDPAGVEMERSNIKNHRHAVGSATSRGAQTAQIFENISFTNQTISGWTNLGDSNPDIEVPNPEKDLDHTVEVKITNIEDTNGNPVSKDMHFAVRAETDLTLNPDFSFSPSSPTVGENVKFEDNTDSDEPPFAWHWRIEDSGGTAVHADYGSGTDYIFDSSGDFDVTLTVNGLGERDILDADSSNNEFTANGDFTADLQNGDAIKVIRSDGNDGVYEIQSFTTNANSNTVITTKQNIDFSYSSGDSTGKLQHKIPPANSSIAENVTKTVTIASASSATISGMDAEEIKTIFGSEKDMIALKDDVEIDMDSVGTQDAASLYTAWNLDDDIGYIVTYPSSSYSEHSINPDVEDNDTGCSDVDIEWFRQKDNDTAFFEFQNEDTGNDICDLVQFLILQNFEVDDTTPFDGIGKYSHSARFNSSTLTDVVRYSGGPDDSTIGNGLYRIASCIVEDHDSNVDPDGDDQTEVEFTADGWYGEGVTGYRIVAGEDDGTVTGTNQTEVYSNTLEGWTVELRPGESRTVTIDSQNHTVELVDTSSGTFDDQAELIVDGNNEGNFEKGDVVVEEDFGERQLRVRKVIHNYDITDRNGNDTGTDYSSVVLETYLDRKDQDVADPFFDTEGDYVATFRFQDSSGDIEGGLNSPFGSNHSTSFTISLNDPPNADFTFSPSNPSVDDRVYFTDESTDPQGDGTINTWEWDFGDGTTETINSAPGDTNHKYSSAGNYDVTLTVTDDQNASDSVTKTVSVDTTVSSLNNPNTRAYESVVNVGGAPTASGISSQLTSSLNSPNVRAYESIGSIGAQNLDGIYADLTLDINSRELSDKYEVAAVTADGTDVVVSGEVDLIKNNHVHDIPRQDDFDDKAAGVGAGAENKEVAFQRASTDSGDVLLDFNTNDEAITLDTTVNGNDVAITVGNIDDDGNITNTERIPSSGTVSNSTATSSNTYQDDELYVRIESANNKDSFEVRDQSGDDVYTLAAAPEERFRSAKASQQTEGVALDDGTDNKQLIDDVSADLLAGSTANHVTVFIDDQPDSGGSTERNITEAIYGSSNSGLSKDKEKSINQSYSIVGVDTSSEIFSVAGDQTSYIESGDNLKVTGSTGNNGTYTVSSTSYDSGNDETDITVNEDITDSTADGTLEWRIVNDSGWYRLKLEPDQASFIKSRIFLDHHKDTQ